MGDKSNIEDRHLVDASGVSSLQKSPSFMKGRKRKDIFLFLCTHDTQTHIQTHTQSQRLTITDLPAEQSVDL